MIGTDGLEGSYPQMDLFSSYTLGDSMTSSSQPLYEAQGDKGFAAFAGGGMTRLKAFIEGRLKLGFEDAEPEDELDFQGASDLIYALGTEMGVHLDQAVWAQQQVDPDRATALIW